MVRGCTRSHALRGNALAGRSAASVMRELFRQASAVVPRERCPLALPVAVLAIMDWKVTPRSGWACVPTQSVGTRTTTKRIRRTPAGWHRARPVALASRQCLCWWSLPARMYGSNRQIERSATSLNRAWSRTG